MMLLEALSSFSTAYLVMFGDYLTIGYLENARGSAYAGMQIWDLHLVFAVLTMVIYLATLICPFCPKLFGKVLSLPKSLVLLLLLTFSGVYVLP